MNVLRSCLLTTCLMTSAAAYSMPLVDVAEYIPDAVFDMRYFGEDNFVGSRIDGYLAPKCLLTEQAAEALRKVQQQLQKQQLSVKIFDCYRPQMAVDHFARWAADLQDNKMKSSYYPDIDKQDLFRLGYIAMRSGHSRGSTVDLTLVKVFEDGSYQPLDMGTPFDFFDPLSHTDNPVFTGEIRDNRQQLKQIMAEHGFVNLPEEWWHFTLADEPYPDQYFEFVIE